MMKKLKILLGILIINFLIVSCQGQAFSYTYNGADNSTFGSQDLDLINYDSSKCVCDITHMLDYDCSCDSDTILPENASVPTTKRKFTSESSNLLIDYPFCYSLKDDLSDVIPSQINSIACLYQVNTPYHGDFYDALDFKSLILYNTQQNYLADKNITHFMLNRPPQTSTFAQLTTAVYLPDFFGFCRLIPLLATDIQSFSSNCKQQLNQNANVVKLSYNTADFSQFTQPLPQSQGAEANSITINIDLTQVKSTTDTSNDQGYSFGDSLSTVSNLKGKFGGIFFSTEQTFTVFKLKKYSSCGTAACVASTTNSVDCKEINDQSNQYVLYYTTIGSNDNTSYQITGCQVKPVGLQIEAGRAGTFQVTFQYLSYTNILQENSYSNRLQVFVKKLFYPLEQFLFDSILRLSILTLLLLYSIFLF